MSIKRYIDTSFWEDKWIRKLDPSERYVYMYLLTNPLTNIAGIYQITIDRMAFDTGYDERTLLPMIARFAEHKKVFYFEDEWMILVNWTKHQKVSEKDNNRIGIHRILQALPQEVYEYAVESGYYYKYLHSSPLEGKLLWDDPNSSIDPLLFDIEDF